MKTLTNAEIELLCTLSHQLGNRCASLIHATDYGEQIFADQMQRCVRSIDSFLHELGAAGVGLPKETVA